MYLQVYNFDFLSLFSYFVENSANFDSARRKVYLTATFCIYCKNNLGGMHAAGARIYSANFPGTTQTNAFVTCPQPFTRHEYK
jgi:hypothetical protein